uniref:RRM domain-containing protein n=1 Tax=Glossina brevipalpis TaxID=37001 RepID=A0A1A9X003_9MUSC
MDSVGDSNDNFMIIDDKAYTEDKVLIYNVFLYRIPQVISDADLREYFQQYGTIALLKTKKPPDQDSRYEPTKIGFIHFRDPNAATNVLKKPTHLINNFRLNVQPSDTWHQPKAKQTIEQVTKKDLIPQIEYISMLNDDCVIRITENLGLGDRIAFALAWQPYRNIFIMTSKVTYKTVLLDNLQPLTLYQVREFLQMVGASVETLKGKILHKKWMRIAELLNRYCRNVKSVLMYDKSVNTRFLRKLLIGMTSLIVLELHYVGLRDEDMDVLKELPNLKVLRLSMNLLKGSTLGELSSIEELSLYYCPIQTVYLRNICLNMKGLRVLDVRRCEKLKTLAFAEIASHCLNLETLKLSGYKSCCDDIAKLPKLKNLVFHAEIPMGPALFIELAKYQSDQLEKLILQGEDCINAENVEYICKLKKLKILGCASSDALDDMRLRELSELSELEEIDVADCKGISNTGLLDFVEKSYKLRRLNIINCTQLKVQLHCVFLSVCCKLIALTDKVAWFWLKPKNHPQHSSHVPTN